MYRGVIINFMHKTKHQMSSNNLPYLPALCTYIGTNKSTTKRGFCLRNQSKCRSTNVDAYNKGIRCTIDREVFSWRHTVAKAG